MDIPKTPLTRSAATRARNDGKQTLFSPKTSETALASCDHRQLPTWNLSLEDARAAFF